MCIRDRVYSFKVTAANRGGESFPSEILSAYKAKHEREKFLIINGFDRISGPAVINTPDKAGFDLEQDPGVPYLSLIHIYFLGNRTHTIETKRNENREKHRQMWYQRAFWL